VVDTIREAEEDRRRVKMAWVAKVFINSLHVFKVWETAITLH